MFKLDNTQSQINCSQMYFSLQQRLSLKAGGGVFNRTFLVTKRDLPGIAAGAQSDASFTALNLPPFQEGDLWQIRRSNSNMEAFVLGCQDVSNVINASTKGSLVQSHYILDVTAAMEGCCAPSPDAEVELSIICPDSMAVQPPQPANWAPQVMSSMTFDLNSQYQVSAPGISVKVGGGGMQQQVNMNVGGGGMAVQQNVNMGGGGGMNVNMNMGGGQVQQTETVQMNMGGGFGGGMQVTETTTTTENFNGGGMQVQETVTTQQNFNGGGMNM